MSLRRKPPVKTPSSVHYNTDLLATIRETPQLGTLGTLLCGPLTLIAKACAPLIMSAVAVGDSDPEAAILTLCPRLHSLRLHPWRYHPGGLRRFRTQVSVLRSRRPQYPAEGHRHCPIMGQHARARQVGEYYRALRKRLEDGTRAWAFVTMGYQFAVRPFGRAYLRERS